MKKKKKESNQEISLAAEQEEESFCNDRIASTFESSVESSFFYTNDKFIIQLDDAEIFKSVQAKYPQLNSTNDDSVIKKQIAAFLDDDEFVQQLMNFYGCTIFDVFTVLHRQYASLFKGPFLKKLKMILSTKNYISDATSRRQHSC